MNNQIAEKMTAEIVGKDIGGWHVFEYLNHGKSAVVFRAERDGKTAALKVFDPDIVERYGREAQLTRINREKALIGKVHPNLVQIFDGGDDGKYLFVSMEYFAGKNLAEDLQEISPDDVRSLIAQVASAAKFLEESSVAHRDIKPSNIGISPDLKTAKLLDFGVVRPFDLSNVTDEGDQKFFVGTLQYSPPELLFREEQPTLEAWRAITFYQLGAVLHDLLTRRPIFQDFTNPYARLVRAVEKEVPVIDSKEADADLRLLAQNCLVKVPSHRLDTVKWEDFSRPKIVDPMDSARRKIAQHKLASGQAAETLSSPEDELRRQSFTLRTSIHSAVVHTIKTEDLPRYSLQTIREDNPYLLRALFEPAPKYGLKSYFCCYVEGRVVDPLTGFEEIRVSACLSPTREGVPAEPDPKAPASRLKGALIEQDIRAQVQQCMLIAYSEALDSGVTVNPVVWLKVEG